MYILVSHLEKEFGVHYVQGGVQELADAMGRVVIDQGGQIIPETTVDQILTKGNRVTGVRLESGREISADIVVSNADPGQTYDHMLRQHTKKRWSKSRLQNSKWSMGLFVWYFGTKGTSDEWSDVGHHTILNGPRFLVLLLLIFYCRFLPVFLSFYLLRPSFSYPSVSPSYLSSSHV